MKKSDQRFPPTRGAFVIIGLAAFCAAFAFCAYNSNSKKIRH